jgi:excinuclease ABC subunit C
MAGRDRDIDPTSELVEEDEEQALPESEEELAFGDDAAPAAGRSVLVRHAKLAPPGPGVYRMLDSAGEVLYVGKAKSIKKRITSYTRPTVHDTRIERVIAATAAVEFVTTATETEALLLEANLIKRLRPRFNVLLRDDKSFPYILITADHWAPQILKHRGARSREGRYYGPFASVWAVNRTITALQRAFLLRSCSDGFFESRSRPCLLHQIKRCSAPCTHEIEFADYAELVREANAFLSGRSQAVRDELSAEMENASAELDFERAAIYRDRLAALSAVQSTQGINPRSTEEADVFAMHQEGGFNGIEVFFFRTGQNWGNRAYFPKADRSLAPGEVLGAFLAQFYDDKPCPSLILLSHDIPERELLAEALSAKSNRKVEVSVPQRGEKKELVAHALVNAREALGRKLADTSSQQKLLKAMAETFELPRAPRRIEVYDNSHIQGSNAVGAMIVAGPAGFQKNQYRKFNIRSADLTPGDDFGMMREVLERRFKRLMAEAPRIGASVPQTPLTFPFEAGQSHVAERFSGHALPRLEMGWWASDARRVGIKKPALGKNDPHPNPPLFKGSAADAEPQHAIALPLEGGGDAGAGSDDDDEQPWPDLVLIDGGQGQLNAARETLAAVGVTDVPMIGVAKGSDRDAGNETFYLADKPAIKLPPRDPLLYFIQRLRDEAHRFAIGSHRTRRKKDIREAGLQEIPGIGPTRKRALLHHFGTLKAIERASLTDLAKVPGINEETARKIHDFFHETAGTSR